MTKFQKQFILKCLTHIDTIISNDSKLQGAILLFNQVKKNEPPHEIPKKITGSDKWSTAEKLGLSAAILQATSLSSFELCTERNLEDAINEATNLLLNKYVPLITLETESGNRLASVKKNIAKVKLQIEPKPTPTEYVEENPYLFFTAVTVGVGLIATAAIALTR